MFRATVCLAALVYAAAAQAPPPLPNPDIHYRLGPDSLPQDGVPKGEIRGPFNLPSQVFPGTSHTYWVYVPAQYDASRPTALMVFNDGHAFLAPEGDLRTQNVLDNLIYRREIPVMLAVFINPGRRPDQPEPHPKDWGDRNTNRPTEYNSLDDRYARVIVDELLPALAKDYNISKDPEQRGIGGASSGAIAAFSVAWERPSEFRKVLSLIGSFTNIRGGHAYADIVRKSERKPIRIFLQDGRNDNRGERRNGSYDPTWDWFHQNVRLKDALVEKGYDLNYTWGIGRHSQKQGGAVLPEMMRWLWRDHPASTDAKDSVERSFRQATKPAPAQETATGGRRTKNVIFVMTDGLRWQEMFSGADAALLNKENGAVARPEELKKRFWRDTPEERRKALLPFVWEFMAAKGQIYGNRTAGSDAYVTNGLNFSYPGYNETLTGFPDPRINSNDKIPNPNVTVLEWLHRKPAFQGKVAAFGAWDVISAIVNGERGGFVANAGYDPLGAPMTPAIALLNRLKVDTKLWDVEPFDSFPFHTALEYLKTQKPRVMFLSLGETDEWAHEGRYEQYLLAANRVDAYLKELWETLQSMPEYRDSTALVFSPDHGRGEAPTGWKGHGQKLPDSKYIWMAFLGPEIKALGERKSIAPVTQNQIAATIAALLGEDYAGAVPKAGKPITEILQ